MALFKPEDKMAMLVHKNHFLLPVLNRFEIRLGFKDKTVHEICENHSINENFFLTIVNTYTHENYFPEEELMTFSPLLLIDYLQKTHKYYFDYLFPKLENRLNRLLQSCSVSDCTDLKLIETFYNKYKTELSRHIEEEEKKVFPYIIATVQAFEQGKALPENFGKYQIKDFEQKWEHTQVDQKIYDLKNIVIKYLEPLYNDNYCNEFLFSIFQFEKDLLDHARIEDKILFRKVAEIEKTVKNG